MFGRMMNNYYYGKSGKGDFRKEDMPENRWELFWDTLRTRLSALFRLNLMYMIIWLPAIIVMVSSFLNLITNTNTILAAKEGTLQTQIAESAGEEGAPTYTEEDIATLAAINPADYIQSVIYRMLVLLIPCIAITGPMTAGLSYVTRNWARDEHAFIWSDFKDAVKLNWKQSLVISVITGLIPFLAYVSWQFYGQMAAQQPLMVIPQVLVLMLAVIWSICVTYMHPLIVSYDLKLRGVIRNAMLLGVARLPMSVGIRLLHCLPLAIGFLLCYLWHPIYGVMIVAGYYVLIGFSLSRFVTASYTNAVFDRFINSRIEGAVVNRGLRQDTDDDEDEDEAAEEVPAEENNDTQRTE